MKKLIYVLYHYVKGFFKKNENTIFTKDYQEFQNDKIGEFTYGRPIVNFRNSESTLEIGKFCSIASNVVIFLGGNHRVDWISTFPFNKIEPFKNDAQMIIGHPATKGSVKIGNDVWIGEGVTILSGVTIGDGAVVGTKAVIAKDIGPYEVWVGNPARLIKKRFSEDEIEKLLEIKWWDLNQKELRDVIPVICSNQINVLTTYFTRNP